MSQTQGQADSNIMRSGYQYDPNTKEMNRLSIRELSIVMASDSPTERLRLGLPYLKLPVHKGTILQKANTLLHMISNKTLNNPTLVNDFMYSFAITSMREKLPQPWITYGHTIGGLNEEIHPFSMYQVIEEGGLHYEYEACPTDSDIVPLLNGLFFTLCALNRLVDLDDGQIGVDYKKLIQEKIRVGGANEPWNITGMTVTFSNGKNLTKDPTYRKIISGLDMFCHKFKNNKYAGLRLGTLGIRYEGCTGCGDVRIGQIIVGGGVWDMMMFSYHPAVTRELKNLLTTEDELEIEDSIFPYIMGTGASTKSPYSSGVSPHLHFWVHVIGCLTGQDRSIKAKIVGDVNRDSLYTAALVVSYFKSDSMDFVATMDSKSNSRLPDIHQRIEMDAMAEGLGDKKGRDLERFKLTNPDGVDVFGYLSENKEDLKLIQEWGKVKCGGEALKGGRKGTISEWLYSFKK